MAAICLFLVRVLYVGTDFRESKVPIAHVDQTSPVIILDTCNLSARIFFIMRESRRVVDRDKVTPFLLRIFHNPQIHLRLEEYQKASAAGGEVVCNLKKQIYLHESC